MAWRIRLTVAAAVIAAFPVAFLASRVIDRTPLPPPITSFIVLLIVLFIALLIASLAAEPIITRFTALHDDLGNALRAFRDGDFSLRLAEQGDQETAELKRLYNELADVVRADRNQIYEKEVLLDTILQRTPVAVVLLNPAQRVLYSNAAARELLSDGARLDGRLLEDIARHVDAPLREAMAGEGDSIFSVTRGDREETFQLTHRPFRLNEQLHHLLLLERLTAELRRQEVSIWKNAIRVINHEMNNSLAPVRSLFHSARRAGESPAHQHKVEEIHDLIDERLNSLQAFLESYAQFARIPAPRKERTGWTEVLDAVATMYPFRREGQHTTDGTFDRMQMQQVLINLVKNAHESGSDPGEIVVSIHRTSGDHVLRVLDRGRGMTDEVMRSALLPFYTTKPGGTGIGLALCNDIIEAHGGRMRLQARDGGGTVVTCWIPA